MYAPKIRNLVGGLGLVIALVVAVAAPLGYFVQGYLHVADELAFKSQINAGRVAKYIYANESVWRFQPTRLSDLIEVAEQGAAQVHQRILAANGRPVVEDERTLAAPVERVRQPIMVRGEAVAWLEAETSLRPLLTATAGVGLASSLLGLLAWLTVRLLPLRVLDDTLARLSTQSARFEAQSVRFQAALDNMTQGLCLFDAEGRLIVHNQRFAAMFGAPPIGAPPIGAPPTGAPPTGAHASTLMAVTRVGDASGLPDFNRSSGPDSYVHDLPDGRVIQVSRQAIPGQGWVATYEDITERRRSQDQLSHMARHDALTGLPNRVKFREHIEETLSRARRDGGVAVLYLDLDGFKGVNDTLGHAAGDGLLRAVAARLCACTRETDLVARLGSDEFAIIQAGAAQPAEVALLADRLVQAVRAPFEVEGQRVEVGASIGVVLADAAATADGLLRNADLALYRAKAEGRGTWRFFEAGMDAAMQARRALEADLRRALLEGQFELFYQPLIHAATEWLAGFEALVRWNHPARGLVSPAEFIALAEETGLIRPLGAWVLGRACADAAGWPAHVKVAGNLSPVQFVRGTLVGEVKQALAASGLAPGRLELEITESVLL